MERDDTEIFWVQSQLFTHTNMICKQTLTTPLQNGVVVVVVALALSLVVIDGTRSDGSKQPSPTPASTTHLDGVVHGQHMQFQILQ
jgi:hypothetical protein